jgi:guanine deaminase
MRIIAGLTGIDRNAPADYVDTPDNFYRDSVELIERFHRQGRNLYAITPRFAAGASAELLARCERLKTEYPDCWVNTHISENPTEIRMVLDQHRDCRDYLGVYEKYGLVGPKFSGGHGVYLSDDEFCRMSRKGAAVVFCPCSNLFLGSGLFRLGRATDPDCRVRLSFGSDIGGGNRFSMLAVLDEAYKVGMCNNTMLDGSLDPATKNPAEAERNKLSPYRGFWSVTLGGAEGLYIDDVLGNFEPGKEADFVALDWNGGPIAMPWHQSLACSGTHPDTKVEAADLLFGIMMVGDDRAVDETWVMGRRLYKKR